ncbi:MAG: NUDIX hydrolase [Candidatus Aenigmatarchaeota archaeon]
MEYDIIAKTETHIAKLIHRLFSDYRPVPVMQRHVEADFPYPTEVSEPNYSAYVILENEDGEMLFIRGKGFPDEWGIPGGTQEEGENFLDTLHRELPEEVNVDATIEDLLFIERIEWEFPDKEKNAPFLTVFFRGKLKEGYSKEDVEIQEEELLEARWFKKLPDKVQFKELLERYVE